MADSVKQGVFTVSVPGSCITVGVAAGAAGGVTSCRSAVGEREEGELLAATKPEW